MPLYRIRYRPKSTAPSGPWTTYVDPANTEPQTDPDGDVDTGEVLGGAVTITGLSNGVTYEFVVDRVDAGGGAVRSSSIAEETPAVPTTVAATAGAGSDTSDGNGQSTVSAGLTTRNGVQGVIIEFGNASWREARAYFRPRSSETFPGDPGDGEADVVGIGTPNLSVTRRPFVVIAASVSDSGDPGTQCFKVDNKRLFVPFDYTQYSVRVRATYASNDLSITVLSPD